MKACVFIFNSQRLELHSKVSGVAFGQTFDSLCVYKHRHSAVAARADFFVKGDGAPIVRRQQPANMG